MARLPYLSADDLEPVDRDLLARDLNLYYELAHSPDGARAFAAPALYVRHHSPLDPRLRELAILQVGFLTRIAYEYAHHIEIALGVGVTESDIHAVALESQGKSSALGDFDRAVLRAARELVAGPALSDATFEMLRSGLNETELVDLILVISVYCGVVRVLGALQIDLEPAYLHYLEKFPLPDRA